MPGEGARSRMSIVSLVSGGLDSTLMAKLADEEGVRQFPLFVDYGQISRDLELQACTNAMSDLNLPEPSVANLGGYGELIRSGLTDRSLHISNEAFTPGRNMLFLLTAAAYACQVAADGVSIGLLHEDTSLFPDQTAKFLSEAENMIRCCMGRDIKILAPLSMFHKVEVVELARQKGIKDTYSCHSGNLEPCGECIACNEFKFEGGHDGRR